MTLHNTRVLGVSQLKKPDEGPWDLSPAPFHFSLEISWCFRTRPQNSNNRTFSLNPVEKAS